MSDLELREKVATLVMGLNGAISRNTLQGALFYGDSSRPVPAYESDIAAAWLVVERMRERHYYFLTNTVPAGCYAVFRRGVDDPNMADPSVGPKFEGYGDTVPEAICRAALAAIEATQ